MSFRNSCVLILFLFSSIIGIRAQSSDPVLKSLNNYIHYSNESVHGLLIIHRLLENFNQDINKFVDLEAIQINFYSNKDLPKNIFIDEEHWFYEVTPSEWYAIAINESKNLSGSESQKLNQLLKILNSICNQLNTARFDIEAFITSHDLTLVENQERVYEMLEQCVSWYDEFYQEQRKLIEEVRNIYSNRFAKQNTAYSDIYGRLFFIHKTAEDIFKSLRAKEVENFSQYLTEIEKHHKSLIALKSYKSSNYALKGKKFSQTKAKVADKVLKLIERSDFFYGDGSVPKEYKLYGKFYYFHNSDLINKFNRYGNGFVTDMNAMINIASMPVTVFSEMPHFYQVIYPEKLIKEDHIVSSDPDIELLPTKLRDRNIVTNTRKILVDSSRIEIKLFDHKIQDGDIVSLNFNGDWILDEQSIENKPMTLKLKLNEEGKNYLLLHAENLGRRPPNTLGISYFYKGQQKKIILESDLNASEMIEIDIDGT